ARGAGSARIAASWRPSNGCACARSSATSRRLRRPSTWTAQSSPAVRSHHGAVAGELPVRRRAIRGDAAVSPRQSLPLLALPQALRDVRPDAGTRSARRLSIARRPRAAPRLPAAGRNGSQGLLLGLRLLTLRR